MATYTAIHLQSENRALVQTCLVNFLQQTHGRPVPQVTESDSVSGLYGREFIESGKVPPTIFAMASTPPGWITVHYNSFFRFREFLASLARELECLVILIMAQTVSSAYHLAVYHTGKHLRTLEFADGSWHVQEGTPLRFEIQPLGRNIASEDEEPYYSFDATSVREYCEQLGLKLWRNRWLDESNEQWTVLRV